LRWRLDLASLLLPDVPASAHDPARKRPATRQRGRRCAPFDRRPVDASAAEPSSSTFDVVRIESGGLLRCLRGARRQTRSVTVMANQKPVASAKANSDGQWAA